MWRLIRHESLLLRIQFAFLPNLVGSGSWAILICIKTCPHLTVKIRAKLTSFQMQECESGIIGGSKGAPFTRAPAWGVQILSFSCSFRQKNLQNNTNLEVGAPTLGKSWIPHWVFRNIEGFRNYIFLQHSMAITFCADSFVCDSCFL